MNHETKVEPYGNNRHRARCSCRWLSSSQDTGDKAKKAGEAHVREETRLVGVGRNFKLTPKLPDDDKWSPCEKFICERFYDVNADGERLFRAEPGDEGYTTGDPWTTIGISEVALSRGLIPYAMSEKARYNKIGDLLVDADGRTVPYSPRPRTGETEGHGPPKKRTTNE